MQNSPRPDAGRSPSTGTGQQVNETATKSNIIAPASKLGEMTNIDMFSVAEGALRVTIGIQGPNVCVALTPIGAPAPFKTYHLNSIQSENLRGQVFGETVAQVSRHNNSLEIDMRPKGFFGMIEGAVGGGSQLSIDYERGTTHSPYPHLVIRQGSSVREVALAKKPE